jgi:hypothetical protein
MGLDPFITIMKELKHIYLMLGKSVKYNMVLTVNNCIKVRL